MNSRKYKLLIVDDEKTILELLSDFFKKFGYDVTVTDDPFKAVKIIENGDANIVLTDIKMPKMSGIELLKKIKVINGLVQVIIMTGYGSLENTVECLEMGANDYLLKPFKNMDEVRDIVDMTAKKLTRWENVISDIYVK